MKKRCIYAAMFLLLLGVEIYIAENVHDRFIRPYAGDVFVAVLLCCLVRAIWPRRFKHLPLYVFLFAAFVEILQGTVLSSIPFIKENPMLSIALGSVFDWTDILCYAVGCAGFYLVEKLSQRCSETMD